MSTKRMRTLFTLGALSAAIAGAPSAATAADVVIGVPNWPSVRATANIMKVVIEDNLGLEVELQNGTNPVIFEAMEKGSMHVHPEVWLPNQDSLFQQYSDAVTRNENSAAAVQGICVNEAAQEAGFSNIADLADPTKAELLDGDGDGRGDVFIGATGWASTNVEKVKGRSYGYDATVDLVELDEGVAYSQLDAAQTAGEPWAGFCYTPHHLFTVHPGLVMLEEPPYDESGWNVLQPDEDPEWLEKSSAAMAWPDATRAAGLRQCARRVPSPGGRGDAQHRSERGRSRRLRLRARHRRGRSRGLRAAVGRGEHRAGRRLAALTSSPA